MKELLNNLIEHKTLSRIQTETLLAVIASEKYTPSQFAVLLSVFLKRLITVEDLSEFRDKLFALSLPLDFGSQDTIDIVGTVGEGKKRFNISILTCFMFAVARFNGFLKGELFLKKIRSEVACANLMKEVMLLKYNLIPA